jgi:hypothetical protein
MGRFHIFSDEGGAFRWRLRDDRQIPTKYVGQARPLGGCLHSA